MFTTTRVLGVDFVIAATILSSYQKLGENNFRGVSAVIERAREISWNKQTMANEISSHPIDSNNISKFTEINCEKCSNVF